MGEILASKALTPNELKAIEYKMQGFHDQQIGLAIGCSRSTIQRMWKRMHVKAYLEKVKAGLMDVTELETIKGWKKMHKAISDIVLSGDSTDRDRINAFKALAQIAGLNKSTSEIETNKNQKALEQWLGEVDVIDVDDEGTDWTQLPALPEEVN